MERFIGTGQETPKELLELLTANSDDVEIMDYTRYFDEEELKDKTEELIEKSVDYEKLSDEKEKIVKSLTAKMKPLKIATKTLLTEIKNKGEKIKGSEVYVFVDQDAKKVNYVSPEGLLISSRPAMRTELKQPGIFNMTSNKTEESSSITIKPSEMEKTGTDDFSFPGEDPEEDPVF